MKVLVTGGAGYIGSHVAQLCKSQGHEVIVYDNLSTGFREAVPQDMRFILGDVRDFALVDRVLRDQKIEAVLHFAAKLLVEESMHQPLEYYENNIGGLNQLLLACKKNKVNRFVFSSTAAVYGLGKSVPLVESSDKKPINPYGHSKLICEEILEQYAKVNPDFKYIALRYFNVAGASEWGSERVKHATHLVKVAAQHATGQRESMSIFGNDYNTHDGTCVRDYIHILDLADAHFLALKYLSAEPSAIQSHSLNCGYGKGASVKEVLDVMQSVIDHSMKIILAARRPGDPDFLVAETSQIRKVLGWVPKHEELSKICQSAVEWEKHLLATNFYSSESAKH